MKLFSAIQKWLREPEYQATYDRVEAMIAAVEPMVLESAPEKQERLKANTSAPMLNTKISECMSKSMNVRPYIDFMQLTAPQVDHRIWVYNCSRETHVVDHPTLGTVKIPGNTSRKKYALYTSFPGVVSVPSESLDENSMGVNFTSGERFAMDLINPDNLGTDQNTSPKWSVGIGRNLGVKGVFWSRHNPPKREEVAAPVARMEARYKDLLERAQIILENNIISATGITKYMVQHDCSLDTALIRLQAERIKDYITPEHHAAAEYFKVTSPWHPALTGKVPNV